MVCMYPNEVDEGSNHRLNLLYKRNIQNMHLLFEHNENGQNNRLLSVRFLEG